jgi:serine/threonine protein kinase/dipeptidyl aminopeptidase/acylaminoacyl peptidase
VKEADQSPHLIRFESFEVNLRSGELSKNGQKVRLQEQSFQILAMLLERTGEVVMRNEIRKRLWPNDTIVEFENSINAAVKRLRLALDDSADNPRYIETLARRGYRWMGSVELVNSKLADPLTPASKALEPPTESVAFNLTGKRISHFRVLEILGGGGMGVVYRAEDIKLGRRVALKALPEELAGDASAMERFEREARAASALNHPNICTIYGVEEYEGQLIMVMELLEGQTLRELISPPPRAHDQRGPLPLEKLLDLALQIVAGLHAAHDKGIIHRDLKPANIFVTTHGQAKILDFGLAKLQEPEAPEVSTRIGVEGELTQDSNLNLALTRTGLAIGTAGYMSPEQVRGEKLDVRTDLFSVGLVLYEMATGQRAFAANTATLTHAAILNDTPTAVRDLNVQIPASLEAVIGKALEKDRELRYQAASEIRADLKRLKRDIESGRTAAALQAATSTSHARHRRWPLVAGGIALPLIIAGTMWLAKRQPAPAREIKLRRLTTNSSENGVWPGSAISPDGKYLAYRDGKGMQIELIETGDTQTVPEPEELQGRVSWEVAGWFPDSTRFLANAHPAGQGDPDFWGPPGTSIWVVPVVGRMLHRLRDDATASAVSPDGSLIAFVKNSGNREITDELWLMDPNGEQQRKLFAADVNNAIDKVSWSPDGQRLLYLKVTAKDSGGSLESRDLRGGKPTTIVSSLPNLDYLWLPDGRLIYSLQEPQPNERTCNFWEMRLDPRTSQPRDKPKHLTNWTGFCAGDPSVTSDGRRLAFREWVSGTSVYTADLLSNGSRISPPKRLTLNDGLDFPAAWTADSKAVVFNSNRNGHFGIFKQLLGQDTSEAIVALPQNVFGASVSPDGRWVIYLGAEDSGPSAPDRVMRVPITGGPPQFVMEARVFDQIHCGQHPASLCAFAEQSQDHKQLIFTAFDAMKGRGNELARANVEPNRDYAWALSPEGTHIAVLTISLGKINLLSFGNESPREILVKGWSNLDSVSWTADGKALLASVRMLKGTTLLRVDLQGQVLVLWKPEGGRATYAVPSPDGRHVALLGWTLDSNIWMMENF